MENLSVMEEIHTGLIGSRIQNSLLVIRDYEPEDYEMLWKLCMEGVIIPMLNRRGLDYYFWLGDWAHRYHRKRNNSRYYAATSDPLIQNRPEELCVQQQLAIIKFYIMRRVNSGY